MSGVLRDELAEEVCRAVGGFAVNHKDLASVDAVLTHPRVAAALRVLDELEGATLEDSFVRIRGEKHEFADHLLDSLRAVAVEQ